MSNLSEAAAALGAPEPLVQRSAEARAKATGVSVDDILTAWAGGGSTPAAAATTGTSPSQPEPKQSEVAPTAVEEKPDETPPESTGPGEARPGEPASLPAAAPGATPPPTPATVSPSEALAYPVVVSVPTAGLRERTASTLPRWIAALFIIIPAFGLLYFSGNAGAGSCTEGGFQLAVDRVTGLAENCDGSAYEGKGGLGGGGAQFLAAGQQTYTQCAACHGAGGAGAGAFPALNNVRTDFSSCADHIEWVTLGTNGFRDAGRATYGDTAKPVGGSGAVMPAFGTSLTPEQLASVVAYERVSFGGGDPQTELVDCGLVQAAGTGSTDTTGGSGATTATTAAPQALLGRNG